MEIFYYQITIVILLLLLAFVNGSRCYYKGYCDIDENGWQDEALFWRNIFIKTVFNKDKSVVEKDQQIR